ncbi:hypothetical protein D3C72_2435700 [compost metagenome]
MFGRRLFGTLLFVFDPPLQIAIVVAAVIKQFGPAQRLFVAVHFRAQIIGQFAACGQAP